MQIRCFLTRVTISNFLHNNDNLYNDRIYCSIIATDMLRLLGLWCCAWCDVISNTAAYFSLSLQRSLQCWAGQTPCRYSCCIAKCQEKVSKVTPHLYRQYVCLHRVYTYYILPLYNMYRGHANHTYILVNIHSLEKNGILKIYHSMK